MNTIERKPAASCGKLPIEAEQLSLPSVSFCGKGI